MRVSLNQKLAECLEWYRNREINVHKASPNIDYILWADRLIKEARTPNPLGYKTS